MSEHVKIDLTRRQREICLMMFQGRASKDMAKLLHISPRTVDDHRQGVLRKYHVASTAELVHLLWGDDVQRPEQPVS